MMSNDQMTPLPIASTAGAQLRAAREALGLSQDAVAQQLKLAPRQVREIGADREVVDAAQVELIARHREVIVAEEADQRLEIDAIRRDRVRRYVALVRQVVEEIADLAGHARHSRDSC